MDRSRFDEFLQLERRAFDSWTLGTGQSAQLKAVHSRNGSINGDPGNGLSFPERVSENRPKVRTFVLVPCEDERHMDC